PFVVRRRIGRHLGNHFFPRRRSKSGRCTKSSRIQTTIDNKTLVRIEANVRFVFATDKRQQTALIDRVARNMIKPVQIWMFNEQICHYIGKDHGWKAAVNCPGKAFNLFAPIAQKPFDKAMARLELATNERRPDGQTSIADDFAQKLTSSIKVLRVRLVRFRVVSLLPRKNAVCADQNKPVAMFP